MKKYIVAAIAAAFALGACRETKKGYDFTPVDNMIGEWIEKDYYPGSVL